MTDRDHEQEAAKAASSRPLRSFGRTGGRPLSARRAELVRTLLPVVSVAETGDLQPHLMFESAPTEVWLEIGFGGGEHLATQASNNPQAGIIGAEPFVEGVAKLLSEIDERSLANVRIHAGDAREMLARLPGQCIDRVFIMFPDPWPKSRHQKRRLVQPEFLEVLARVLKGGAGVRFATDVADYADRTLAACLADGRFAWNVQRAEDWRNPPADHVTTRYESKRLGDCPPVFFDFRFDGPAR